MTSPADTLDPASAELTHAQVREDPAIELAVVERLAAERRRPLRVLVVASGGCTALSLLTSSAVGRLDAVDANPAQLHLVALRAQAIQRLSLLDQLAFLGGRGEVAEGSRARFYEVVRDHLPVSARDYWDARPAAIAFGANRGGRLEALFRELAAAFAERKLDPVARPAEALTHKAWPTLFESVLGRERLTAVFGPAALAYTTVSPGGHFAAAFARAMLRHAPADNYFLHQAWRDAYASGEDALPLYMQPLSQAAILRNGLHRLKLHEGKLETVLPALAADGQFDLISTGDLTDWLSHATAAALLSDASKALAPGGAVLARRTLGNNDLATELGRHLRVDAAFSAQLLARDRAFVATEIVVAQRAL